MTERTLEDIEKDIQSTLAGEEVEEPEETEDPEETNDEELPEEEQEDEEDPEVTSEEPETDAEKAMALGWKPFQEYVDEGGDPDMYRGARAFLQFHDDRKGSKEKVKAKNAELESLRDELKNFGDMLVEQRKTQQEEIKRVRQQEREKLTKELEQKKEDLDPEGYHEVKTKLAELGDDTEEQPQQREEHTVITNFRTAEGNEMFDYSSPDFDPEINSWLEQRVNTRLDSAYANGMTPTDKSLEKYIQEEYERTKRAFPEKFGDAEPKRKGQRRRAPQTSENAPSKGAKPSRKLDAQSQAVYDSMVRNGRKAAAKEFKTKMLEA